MVTGFVQLCAMKGKFSGSLVRYRERTKLPENPVNSKQ